MVGDIPPYPIERDVRLPGHHFIKWDFNRWLNSAFFLTASYEVQGVGRALFDIAQNQTPLGTLPDDDLQLARLLHLDVDSWKELRARPIGPLHKWFRVGCGNEVRLGHPEVLAVLQDAISGREQRDLSREERAEVMRIERLAKGMAKAGLGSAQISDRALLTRIDDWLKQSVRGNRTAAAYEQAFQHAVRQRWIE
jgi:hypothetical protein